MEEKKKETGKKEQVKIKRRESRKGVLSCWYAVLALLLFAACLIYAYVSRGSAAGIVGSLAVLALFLAILGIRSAAGGFSEAGRGHFYCKIGLAACIVVILIFVGLFALGISRAA